VTRPWSAAGPQLTPIRAFFLPLALAQHYPMTQAGVVTRRPSRTGESLGLWREGQFGLSRGGCWVSRISIACQRARSPNQKALSLALRASMARHGGIHRTLPEMLHAHLFPPYQPVHLPSSGRKLAYPILWSPPA
jgi:hypothetical protein